MNVRPTSFAALIAAVLLLPSVSALSARAEVPHGGFEQADPAGAAGWSVDGALPPGADVARDPGVKHAGAASLRLSAASPASITVASDEVRLEVGHVYRLSAFVRTENAVSDPTGRCRRARSSRATRW